MSSSVNSSREMLSLPPTKIRSEDFPTTVQMPGNPRHYKSPLAAAYPSDFGDNRSSNSLRMMLT